MSPSQMSEALVYAVEDMPECVKDCVQLDETTLICIAVALFVLVIAAIWGATR